MYACAATRKLAESRKVQDGNCFVSRRGTAAITYQRRSAFRIRALTGAKHLQLAVQPPGFGKLPEPHGGIEGHLLERSAVLSVYHSAITPIALPLLPPATSHHHDCLASAPLCATIQSRIDSPTLTCRRLLLVLGQGQGCRALSSDGPRARCLICLIIRLLVRLFTPLP